LIWCCGKHAANHLLQQTAHANSGCPERNGVARVRPLLSYGVRRQRLPLFESLDTIDWGVLTGCYQPAADMPELLRSFLSPAEEVRRWAIERIGSAVFHQGTVYSVTPVVLPFLFELLENDEVQDKEYVVGLLTALSGCCAYLETNVTSAEERSQRDAEFRKSGSSYDEELRREHALVQGVKSEIARRFELIYPYLRFPDDAWIRLAVAEALGRLPKIAAQLRPDLEAALQSENDKYVRNAITAAMASK